MDHQPSQIGGDALCHVVDVVEKRTLFKVDMLSERNPILSEFMKKGSVHFSQLVNHNITMYKTFTP